jgi:hypothetical protein
VVAIERGRDPCQSTVRAIPSDSSRERFPMLISADLLHSTDRLATGAGVFISHRLRRVLATFEVFGSVAAALVVAL